MTTKSHLPESSFAFKRVLWTILMAKDGISGRHVKAVSSLSWHGDNSSRATRQRHERDRRPCSCRPSSQERHTREDLTIRNLRQEFCDSFTFSCLISCHMVEIPVTNRLEKSSLAHDVTHSQDMTTDTPS